MRLIVLSPLVIAGFILLPSCILISAPFKIVGGVVEGTYAVGEKVVTAPIDAYDRRQERKEAREAELEKKGLKDKEKDKQKQPAGGAGGPVIPIPQQTPLPPEDTLPPLDPPQ